MRRAERLFRLVNEMRARDLSRSQDLAAHFEVSVSTIYRDIAHLQASGLPIEGEAGVGYVLRPGFDLPSMTFTHDQIEALAVGLSFVERTGDPALIAAAQEARAKLQAGLPDPEERRLSHAPYYNLHPKKGETARLGAMRTAIRQQQIVEISYCNAQGEASQRRLRPLVIWDLVDGWMVSGWCELKADFRTFRSDRIQTLDVTGERFQEDETTGLLAFMRRETCETHRQ